MLPGLEEASRLTRKQGQLVLVDPGPEWAAGPTPVLETTRQAHCVSAREGGVKPGTGRCSQAERRLTASAPAFPEPRARETTEWSRLELCG